MRKPLVACLVCVLTACGGDSASKDDNQSHDNDANAGEAGDIVDGLSPTAALDVPGPASAMAASVLDAVDFNAALAATIDILAEGGIATAYNGDVQRAGKAPASSMFTWQRDAIDLALEAHARRTMYSVTLADFGAMMTDLGMVYPANVSPSDFWVRFMADWYTRAAANPDAPDSFAVLFIAAMNDKQVPRANVSTGVELPELIRLSVLETQLLIAAFERSAVITTVASTPLGINHAFVRAQSASPCSDLLSELGIFGQGVGIVVSEVSGTGIGEALKTLFGESADAAGNVLSSLGTLAKLQKLVQQFRFGYIKLRLETASTVRKPLNGQANKTGELLAVAGVDQEELDQAEQAAGGAQESTQEQAAKDCLGALGIPSLSDVRNIANDAANWRAQFSIVAGGGSQVLWARGETGDILSRTEKYLTRASDSTATTSINFDILPQATKAEVGKERTRKAVFKVQLKRGSIPDLATAWGSGKAGLSAGNANPIGAVLGLSDALVDVVGKWILEQASPSAYVTQTLTEIQPTGLVGTIDWKIEGSRKIHDPGMDEDYVDTSVQVRQTGHLEIVSQADDKVTAFGGENCSIGFLQTTQFEDQPEGSEVVGTGYDRTATIIGDVWQSDPDPEDVGRGAGITDWDEILGNAPPEVLTPEAEALLGTIWIVPDGSIVCPVRETMKGYLVVDQTYESNMWTTTEDFAKTDSTIRPLQLAHPISITKDPTKTVFEGSREELVVEGIQGFDVETRQTVTWKLRQLQ